jgi:hypothetical protein
MFNRQTQQVSFPTTSPNLHQSRRPKSAHSGVNPPRNELVHTRFGQFLKAVKFGEPLQLGLRWMPLAHGFLLELRSLAYRMRLRHTRRYDVYGLDLGPCHQPGSSGHLEMNTRTLACIADIENFLSVRPWATTVDLEVYRDAWVKGAEWGKNRRCSTVLER